MTISIAQYYVNKDAISCNWDVAQTTCMKSTITQYSITLNLNSIIIHSTKMLHTLPKASNYIYFEFELKIQIHYTLFIHHHHAHLSLTSIYLIHINTTIPNAQINILLPACRLSYTSSYNPFLVFLSSKHGIYVLHNNTVKIKFTFKSESQVSK